MAWLALQGIPPPDRRRRRRKRHQARATRQRFDPLPPSLDRFIIFGSASSLAVPATSPQRYSALVSTRSTVEHRWSGASVKRKREPCLMTVRFHMFSISSIKLSNHQGSTVPYLAIPFNNGGRSLPWGTFSCLKSSSSSSSSYWPSVASSGGGLDMTCRDCQPGVVLPFGQSGAPVSLGMPAAVSCLGRITVLARSTVIWWL